MNLIQSRVSGFFALVCLIFCVGCSFDPFSTPPPDVATNPSQQQVQYCRDVMYINPEIVLKPHGYYYEHGFLDDQVAFKFVTESEKIESIFNAKFVPPSELVERKSISGLGRDIGEKWWEPQNHALIGGNFTVPPPGSDGARGLNIGILDNGDSTFTVYVYWFET